MLYSWALCAFGVLEVLAIIADGRMKAKVFDIHDELCDPPLTSIVLPTYREEKWVEYALESIRAQNIIKAYPDMFEVIVVDSNSDDETVKVAEEHADKVLIAPMGKLHARKGIEVAKGSIIVGIDADSFYPPNWLNIILKKFNKPEVVGVAGPRLFGHVFYDSNIFLNNYSVWGNIRDSIRETMYGSNGAFLRSAYYRTGGFDLSIDEFNQDEIEKEEEHLFPSRLKMIRRVDWNWQATIFSSARRFHEKDIQRSF